MRLDRHRKGFATKDDEDLFFQELLNELSKEDEALTTINKKQEQSNLKKL